MSGSLRIAGAHLSQGNSLVSPFVLKCWVVAFVRRNKARFEIVSARFPQYDANSESIGWRHIRVVFSQFTEKVSDYRNLPRQVVPHALNVSNWVAFRVQKRQCLSRPAAIFPQAFRYPNLARLLSGQKFFWAIAARLFERLDQPEQGSFVLFRYFHHRWFGTDEKKRPGTFSRQQIYKNSTMNSLTGFVDAYRAFGQTSRALASWCAAGFITCPKVMNVPGDCTVTVSPLNCETPMAGSVVTSQPASKSAEIKKSRFIGNTPFKKNTSSTISLSLHGFASCVQVMHSGSIAGHSPCQQHTNAANNKKDCQPRVRVNTLDDSSKVCKDIHPAFSCISCGMNKRGGGCTPPRTPRCTFHANSLARWGFTTNGEISIDKYVIAHSALQFSHKIGGKISELSRSLILLFSNRRFIPNISTNGHAQFYRRYPQQLWGRTPWLV